MTKDLLNIKKYNIIFVALILSVFIHIRYQTQLVIIRPFDFITVIIFLYLIFKKEEVKEKIKGDAKGLWKKIKNFGGKNIGEEG